MLITRLKVYLILLFLIFMESSLSAASLDLSMGSETFKLDWQYRLHLLEEEAKKYPNDINLKFLLGSQYLDYNMLKKAKKQFIEIIKVEKNYSLCYVGLGNISILEGADTKQALKYYKQALQFDKTNISIYGYINYALNLEKQFHEAANILEEAIIDNPKQEMLLHNLSLNYLMISESDKAIRTTIQLIELNPLPSYYYMLGLAFVQKKDLNNTIKSFEKGLDISPSDKQLLIGLSQSLYENGQINEANQMINKAFILYPEDKDVQKKIEKYKQKNDKNG